MLSSTVFESCCESLQSNCKPLDAKHGSVAHDKKMHGLCYQHNDAWTAHVKDQLTACSGYLSIEEAEWALLANYNALDVAKLVLFRVDQVYWQRLQGYTREWLVGVIVIASSVCHPAWHASGGLVNVSVSLQMLCKRLHNLLLQPSQRGAGSVPPADHISF